MPLLDFFRSNPEKVAALKIQQIVSNCGDGQLSDTSECAKELREYLRQIESSRIFDYAQACLDEKFEPKGFVLQDLINELGRRLDFEVENGLYQGRPNQVGFDGLWRSPRGHTLVVEVKTTDTYRINLDTLAGYRNRLLDEGRIPKSASILLVVGRQDTGDLEAQIRGSKHGWDIRVLSIEALTKLVTLKEITEEATVEKIHELLIPFEFTRLDRIIDIAFTAASDVDEAAEAPSVVPEGAASEETTPDNEHAKPQFTPTHILDNIRARIVSVLADREQQPLIKKSRALYWNSTKDLRIACLVSKGYATGAYWYAFHPRYFQFLEECTSSYAVLGCVDQDLAFAVPTSWLRSKLDRLHTTTLEDGKSYWHVFLEKSESGTIMFKLFHPPERVSIEEYRLPLL